MSHAKEGVGVPDCPHRPFTGELADEVLAAEQRRFHPADAFDLEVERLLEYDDVADVDDTRLTSVSMSTALA